MLPSLTAPRLMVVTTLCAVYDFHVCSTNHAAFLGLAENHYGVASKSGDNIGGVWRNLTRARNVCLKMYHPSSIVLLHHMHLVPLSCPLSILILHSKNFFSIPVLFKGINQSGVNISSLQLTCKSCLSTRGNGVMT